MTSDTPLHFKVGYVGYGGTRHLLYSWSSERGTWRPVCNSNVDYRRVSTTSNPISERLIGCQRCRKHAWLKLALTV